MKSAGIPVATHSDSADTVQRLYTEAAKLVGQGMDEQDALETITLDPARLLGVDHLVGTIEAGKHADLVMMSHHPLDVYTLVEQTWVDGRLVFNREQEGTPMPAHSNKQSRGKFWPVGSGEPWFQFAGSAGRWQVPEALYRAGINIQMLNSSDAQWRGETGWYSHRIREDRRSGKSIRTGIDVGGSWISPGFVDAGCTLGLVEIGLEDGSKDDTVRFSRYARVWDGYNPASSVIPVTRVEVTHALVHPNPRSLVSGQATLFATVGDTVGGTKASTDPVLCINMGRAGQGGSGGPSSRMGVSMKLRELLDEATKLLKENEKEKKNKKKEQVSDLNQSEQIWLKVRSGQQRVLIKAERADDILKALELVETYELDAILLGAAEGHRVAREIADAQVPVFLGPLTVQPSSFEHLQARYDNAKQLHEAGVALAFGQGRLMAREIFGYRLGLQ